MRIGSPRYPCRGARARSRPGQQWFPAKSRERPKKKASPNGQPQRPLVCLRPMLIKTGGRYCVQFKGRIVSRHRSLALALLVRARVERSRLTAPHFTRAYA